MNKSYKYYSTQNSIFFFRFYQRNISIGVLCNLPVRLCRKQRKNCTKISCVSQSLHQIGRIRSTGRKTIFIIVVIFLVPWCTREHYIIWLAQWLRYWNKSWKVPMLAKTYPFQETGISIQLRWKSSGLKLVRHSNLSFEILQHLSSNYKLHLK